MIQIVFENENFVVCDKPAGVLSTPGRPHENDHRPCLGTTLQESLRVQIYPVHRLDFEVSGLVLYAKNPKAHAKANSWFENKSVQKTYRARTTPQDYSHIPPQVSNPRILMTLEIGQSYNWKTRMLRGKRRAFESPQGKPSWTIAKLLGFGLDEPHLIWDLSPVTGRSHQLRFDLSRHGFPILGDSLYGSKITYRPDSIALRSYRLNFKDCDSAEALNIPALIEVPVL